MYIYICIYIYNYKSNSQRDFQCRFDLAIFPCKPTVLMIGNHSSGK